MEYKGRQIVDEIPKTITTDVISFKGDNTHGDIYLSTEEVSNFIDKLTEARDKMSQEKNDTRLKLDMYEGYQGEYFYDRVNAELFVTIETEEPESDDKRFERIELEKFRIDEEIRIQEETDRKKKEKYTKEVIEYLEGLGYKVHK